MFPLLLLLLAGVLNYGMALRTATAVAMAARSGAQYGSGSLGRAGDSAGIRAAAVDSAPDVAAMTVSSAKSCQCSGGGSVGCSGTCASGHAASAADVQAVAQQYAAPLSTGAMTVAVTWSPDKSPGSTVEVRVSYSFAPEMMPVASRVLTFQSTARQVIVQ